MSYYLCGSADRDLSRKWDQLGRALDRDCRSDQLWETSTMTNSELELCTEKLLRRIVALTLQADDLRKEGGNSDELETQIHTEKIRLEACQWAWKQRHETEEGRAWVEEMGYE